MFFSESWLRELCPTDRPLAELVELLTLSGTAVEGALPVGDDHRLILEITSNRTDCYGHLGIARELSVLTGAPLVVPEGRYETAALDAATRTSVRIDDRERCPRYTAQLLTDLKVGPSPDWLVRRLATIGQPSINNVVDITNYVLWEYSQPLHAFDFDALLGGRIVVRRAAAGEPFFAINHQRYELDGEMLVIADAEKPVALAGLMGGEDTEISEDTTTVLLESAYFEPRSLRRTGRRLGLASDSSRRFERGVDPGAVAAASRRAAHLLARYCGGRVAAGLIDVDYQTRPLRTVAYDPALFRRVMGYAVADDRAAALLAGLGLAPTADGAEASFDRLRTNGVGSGAARRVWSIPSWRPDLERPIDLVEEVARLDGFQHAPDEVRLTVFAPPRDPAWERECALRATVVALGFHEVVTESFAPADGPRAASPWAADDDPAPLELALPRNRQRPALRRSLLPSLVEVYARHRAFHVDAPRLFELAHLYFAAGDEVREWPALGLLAARPYREVKGLIEALFERARVTPEAAPCAHPMFAPETGLVWRLGGATLGFFGRLAPDWVGEGKRTDELIGAELSVEVLLAHASFAPRLTALPKGRRLQSRDVSVAVDEGLRWETLASAVQTLDLPHFDGLRLGAVYRGAPVPPGRKQFEFTIRFASAAGDFSREQVNDSQQRIRDMLRARFDGLVRTAEEPSDAS